MWCNDPFLSYLKAQGFSVVLLPRRDFAPLQIFLRKGKSLEPLGDLSTVIVPGPTATLPPLKLDEPATTIAGQRSSSMSLGVGLNVLGTIIGAMGGSKLGLDVKYKQAKTITFEFPDVRKDSIQIAALDQFLGGSDVNPASTHVGKLLEADDIYVITATIKSDKITVEAKDQSGTDVAVQVPEIQQTVGGSVTVNAATSGLAKLTYSGTDRLVFGFQAVRLFYDRGHYTAFEPLAAGGAAARDLRPSLPAGIQVLESDGSFLRIDGP